MIKRFKYWLLCKKKDCRTCSKAVPDKDRRGFAGYFEGLYWCGNEGQMDMEEVSPCFAWEKKEFK